MQSRLETLRRFSHRLGSVCALMVVGCNSGAGTTTTADSAAPSPAPTELAASVDASPESRAIFAKLLARWPSALPALGSDARVHFERKGSGLRAVTPGAEHASQRKPATTTLPNRATDSSRVEDQGTGLAVGFVLQGATDVDASVVQGAAIYPHAGPFGAHLVQRPNLEGLEDYAVFETKPPVEALHYTIDVSQAAGLRLVAETLELLDQGGVPRLRVAPPYVLDRNGARHAASLAVHGCAVDVSPLAPHGRSVTPPGAQRCELSVSWSDVSYPAIVDPMWQTTGALVIHRALHTATLLKNNRVLIASGCDGDCSSQFPTSTELYDSTTQTFTPTGSMPSGRLDATATLLQDGRVLVVGGQNGTAPLKVAEIYDPDAGTWSTTGPLGTARRGHTATLLGNGRVLVVAGVSPSYLQSAEIYNPTTGMWAPTGSLTGSRYAHTATTLPSGKVLVTGGYSSTELGTSEIFDPALGTWAPTAALATARTDHSAVLLTNGKVLVAGGRASDLDPSKFCELFDPATSKWTGTTAMGSAREQHALTTLTNGLILASGGFATVATTELYDPATGTWTGAGSMAQGRYDHASTLLANGMVLVTGGRYFYGNGAFLALQSAELYDHTTGLSCSQGSECSSGFCVDGVCCNAACGGSDATDCQACNLPATLGKCSLIPLADAKVCRAALNDCDIAEKCSGAATACPADTARAAGYGCADDGNVCTTDLCNGVVGAAECLHDPGNANIVCRPSGGPCDIAETCNGISPTCAADAKRPASTICHPAVDICDVTENCDGASDACPGDAVQPFGTPCRTPTCAAGVATLPAYCTGSATACPVLQQETCAPSSCFGGTKCGGCSVDQNCKTGEYCIAGLCVKLLDNAADCTTGSDCTSGNCADGVCCDASCTNPCEACNLAKTKGTCTPVEGAPVAPRPACDGTGLCKGTCNGAVLTSCTYPGAAVDCAPATCRGDVLQPASACDSAGGCSKPPSQNCAPYACDADSAACFNSCTSDEECAAGAACDTAKGKCALLSDVCADAFTVKQANGNRESCSPYKCLAGKCQQQCETESDCAEAYACVSSECVRAQDSGSGGDAAGPDGAEAGAGASQSAASTGDSSGCGCRLAATGPRGRSLWPLSLAVALGLLRRRRDGRRSAVT